MPNVERLIFDARRYARRHKFVHALKLYDQVLDLEPHHVEALIGKGGCYYKLHDKTWARIAWEEALQVDPKNKKVKEFLHRLGDPDGNPGVRTRNRKKSHKTSPLPIARGPALVLAAVVLAILVTTPILLRSLMQSQGNPRETLRQGPVAMDTHHAGPKAFGP
jgi:tetratricopeptide (TPR) repeat protein